VFAQKHCPAGVVYWTQGGYARIPLHVNDAWQISVPVTLDGQELRALIDTGSPTSAMVLEVGQHLFGWAENDSRLKTFPNGTARFPFAQLAFGDVIVSNPDILLPPRRAVAAGVPDLILGMDVLRQLNVYIAYKERAMYVTSADAH